MLLFTQSLQQGSRRSVIRIEKEYALAHPSVSLLMPSALTPLVLVSQDPCEIMPANGSSMIPNIESFTDS